MHKRTAASISGMAATAAGPRGPPTPAKLDTVATNLALTPDPKNAIMFGMGLLKTEFVDHVTGDQQATGHAYSQTENADE